MKKGLELTINFLVMLVLAAVAFAFGFFIVKNILNSATDISDQLDRQTITQIESLLSQGERVAVPMPHADVKRGDTHIFGIGILNALSQQADFKINVTFSKAIKRDKSPLCNTVIDNRICQVNGPPLMNYNIVDDWLQYDKSEHLISGNEDASYVLGLKAPNNAPEATYIFDVTVSYCTDLPGGCNGYPSNYQQYTDSVYKVYVNLIA